MSMGANMILRVAADMPDFPLEVIVSVNNPFDIWLSINLMRGKIYEKYLSRDVRDKILIRPPISETEMRVRQEMAAKF